MPVMMPEWWNWRIAQWWWYRQYKRADRKAFARECDLIRWRYAWTGNLVSPTRPR